MLHKKIFFCCRCS